VEVQIRAGEWFSAALGLLEAGTVLIFDYGGTAEELVPRRTQGTLRTYRAHHLGPDPLEAPGETDVTADINFTALELVARDAGAAVEILRQDDYLARWGLREVVSELRRRELALARDGDPIERLRLRSERTDAETLLHPRGLGDFRVLIATK
jgi:SAM-dependent MidA family methyltransferase